MELVNLMKKISEDNIPHFLILFGEEQKILELYEDKIAEKLQAKKVMCESVSNFVSTVGRKSIDKSKKVYIVQEDMNYLKAEDSWDKIQKYVRKNYIISACQFRTSPNFSICHSCSFNCSLFIFSKSLI